MKRNNWTRDELMLAFNLYCKLPYGQFNNRNAEVKWLADLLGRTSGAVAYILVNFVSVDPNQKLMGRKGASNISKLGREVFNEFSENFDEMFVASEELLLQKSKSIKTKNHVSLVNDKTKVGRDILRETKVRENQGYFRNLVLSNYSNSCAATGIDILDLLIASHIKPWSVDKANRLNPANGICLSATLDKAFDKGLITINKEFKFIFSQKLKAKRNEIYFDDELKRFENKRILLPMKFLPNAEFLEYHNDVVFQA